MHLCNTVVFLMLQAVFWLSIGVFCLLFFSGSGYKEQSDKMYSKQIQNTSKTHTDFNDRLEIIGKGGVFCIPSWTRNGMKMFRLWLWGN